MPTSIGSGQRQLNYKTLQGQSSFFVNLLRPFIKELISDKLDSILRVISGQPIPVTGEDNEEILLEIPEFSEALFETRSTTGATPFGATQVSICNLGNRDGTVKGTPLPPGAIAAWESLNSLLPFRYDATNTTFLINYVLPSTVDVNAILLEDGVFLRDEKNHVLLFIE